MDVFLDTSVLIAAFEQSHPHHSRAWSVLSRITTKQDTGYISLHSIAEAYAVLTRLPVQPRIHPSEAARIINDNLLPNFVVIALTQDDYLDALALVKDSGWSGAKIYDALLLASAAKSPAERIYTFNLKDFQQLAIPAQKDKICAP